MMLHWIKSWNYFFPTCAVVKQLIETHQCCDCLNSFAGQALGMSTAWSERSALVVPRGAHQRSKSRICWRAREKKNWEGWYLFGKGRFWLRLLLLDGRVRIGHHHRSPPSECRGCRLDCMHLKIPFDTLPYAIRMLPIQNCREDDWSHQVWTEAAASRRHSLAHSAWTWRLRQQVLIIIYNVKHIIDLTWPDLCDTTIHWKFYYL